MLPFTVRTPITETTDMKDIQDAGPFTITIGLNKGREYIYVTHRESGKQWMSKSPVEHNVNHDYLASNIVMGVTCFYPDRVIQSCDSRFWMPVKQLKHS